MNLLSCLSTQCSITVRAVKSFVAVHPLQLAAALSYYMLVSLAPLVLVTVSVASMAFGREAVGTRLVAEVDSLVGSSGAQVVDSVIRNANAGSSGLFLAIGAVTVLLGATGVFVQLQDALNQIWRVRAKPDGSAVWSFLRGRLLSLAMVLGVGFLLLVSLLVSTSLSAVCRWVCGPDSSAWLVRGADALASAIVVTGLLAMIFKTLPIVRVSWNDVWFGAIVTSVLFSVGKHLIALYLGRAGVGSAYGAAGSIVVLMVWVYYASLILLFGAQLTQTRVGHRAELRDGARRATAGAT